VAAKLGILLLMASGDAPEWFGCGGECKGYFFSDDVLGQFLPALMWVPLCVYCNNEVAQLIDGLWWKHARNDDTGRIGLSDALHGYRAVSPLVQVFVVLSAALSFRWYTFVVSRQRGMAREWPAGLKIFMYGSVLGLNGLMVLQLLVGLDCRRPCCRRRQPEPEPVAMELLETLIGGGSERGLTLRV
jgi:hypothetical protein